MSSPAHLPDLAGELARPHREGAAVSVDFEFGPLEEAFNYRTRLVDEFSPYLSGDIVEIGAGIGQVTEILTSMTRVRSVTAVEPEATYGAVLRKRAPLATLVTGTSTSLGGARDFDAILCVNVLEHIRDHGEELARHHRLLKARGGHLCLFVPARQEIYAPIDHDFGHWRRYSRASLRAVIEGAGFEVVRLRYYNFAGYFAWWWSFKVRVRKNFEAGPVRFFDRMIFPWVNGFERRVCAPPFGQSLLAIAKAK